MVFVYVFVGMLLGASIVVAIWWSAREKQQSENSWIEKDKVDITIQDIIRLAALNTTLDVSSLIVEYKINVKMPEFYEKYQILSKQEKELYFNELIAIFSKKRREYVQDLFDRHAGLSAQDVLLLLMCEMQLDNKTIAHIMGLSAETLKKRKTRLKSKMNIGNLPVKGAAET